MFEPPRPPVLEVPKDPFAPEEEPEDEELGDEPEPEPEAHASEDALPAEPGKYPRMIYSLSRC